MSTATERLPLAPHPTGSPAHPAGGSGEAPQQRKRPSLLRWPAPPYLVLLDVAAVVAVLLVDGLAPADPAVLMAMLAWYSSVGLYRSRLSLSVLDDLPYLLLGVLAGTVAALVVDALLDVVVPVSMVLTSVLLLGGVLLSRAVAYTTVKHARRSGRVRHTALVVGAGHVGLRLARTLAEHRELGLDVVGLVDSRPRAAARDLPAPLLSRDENLSDAIQRRGVRVVLVAFSSVPEAELVEILRTCDRLRCEIFIVPRLFEMHSTTRDMDQAWGIPLIRVRRAPFRRRSWHLKRLMDVLLSGTALLALAPLLIACAIAVRIDGGSGVLFRQDRVGLDGRRFTLLKFRSLRPATEEESATRWNVALDHRLGAVGRFLRKTSLDELPQLWNILRGDMSLVGPRPERPHFVEHFGDRIPRYTNRHRVPAGLTGYAQVHGLRGDTSIERRAEFDNYYIENWSLWGDVKIMLRTVMQVVHARGG